MAATPPHLKPRPQLPDRAQRHQVRYQPPLAAPQLPAPTKPAHSAIHPRPAALAQPRDKCDAPSKYAVIEQCGRQEVDKLDAKLNASPRDLTAALKGKTADLQQLVVAQRAWLQYREKTCGFGGARVQFNVPWCFANITQKRIEELAHMAECEREGGGKC